MLVRVVLGLPGHLEGNVCWQSRCGSGYLRVCGDAGRIRSIGYICVLGELVSFFCCNSGGFVGNMFFVYGNAYVKEILCATRYVCRWCIFSVCFVFLFHSLRSAISFRFSFCHVFVKRHA